MDYKNNRIILYTAQSSEVMDTINEKGINHVKKKHIKRKYEDVASIFLKSYNWFVGRAEDLVPKPNESEYPIWAFTDIKYTGANNGSFLITLEVPFSKAIFFRIDDWNRILNLRYLPKDDEDENRYYRKLRDYNITDETDIIMKPFYPQLKSEVKRSWDNLFRFDETIKENCKVTEAFQVSLWEIRKDWIINLKKV
ncbi:DUF3841 domain-containing protein [Sporosalibacterium faouarense]|uniref:DUF3841 domain-containing protein n=1 Tax=Sporosalibacterium faouarense TaxID=516123 RepID=UPI00192C7125|nr:DUF3841 domain-containing protein [Sporosalibacterium faouarense]